MIVREDFVNMRENFVNMQHHIVRNVLNLQHIIYSFIKLLIVMKKTLFIIYPDWPYGHVVGAYFRLKDQGTVL